VIFGAAGSPRFPIGSAPALSLSLRANLPQHGGHVPVVGVADDLISLQFDDGHAAHRDFFAWRWTEEGVGCGEGPEPLDGPMFPSEVTSNQGKLGIGRCCLEIPLGERL